MSPAVVRQDVSDTYDIGTLLIKPPSAFIPDSALESASESVLTRLLWQ